MRMSYACRIPFLMVAHKKLDLEMCQLAVAAAGCAGFCAPCVEFSCFPYFSDASLSPRSLALADIFFRFLLLGCIHLLTHTDSGGYASLFSHFSDAFRAPGQPLRADMHLFFSTSRMHLTHPDNLSRRIYIPLSPFLGCIPLTRAAAPPHHSHHHHKKGLPPPRAPHSHTNQESTRAGARRPSPSIFNYSANRP